VPPHTLVLRACIWSAALGLVFTFVGMAVAGWFPPPTPGDSAAEVGEFYRDNAGVIRIASVMIGVGGVLLIPTTAVVSRFVTRMEGSRGPLSYVQLISGALGPMAFLIPAFFWAAGAYDAGARSDEITKVFHDAGWLAFICGIWTFAVQNLAVGVAILTDRGAKPLLPRWFGYFGVWLAILYMPSCMVVFFHDGPFAWNGILTFWLAAAAFVVWTIWLIVKLDAIIKAEGRAGAGVDASAPDETPAAPPVVV
jgi:hypothetical protein